MFHLLRVRLFFLPKHCYLVPTFLLVPVKTFCCSLLSAFCTIVMDQSTITDWRMGFIRYECNEMKNYVNLTFKKTMVWVFNF